MKTGMKLGSFLIIIALTLTPTSGDAYNPLAHIFIADNACPNCSPKIDYYYGSIAPDIAWSVANPDDWETRAFDTHYRNLSSFARGSTQEAFDRGWLTHSENESTKGADYFAHRKYSRSPSTTPTEPGYVIEKAGLLVDVLVNQFGLENGDQTDEFAHYIIEATIDLLLKEVDPTLPGKLFFVNLFRSWQDRNLLMKAFVWNWSDRKTDWLTLATAELAFRQLINRYATALMLPDSEAALAQLAKKLAKEMYDLDIETDILLEILGDAITLCEEDANENGIHDYLDVIEEAIDEVSENLN